MTNDQEITQLNSEWLPGLVTALKSGDRAIHIIVPANIVRSLNIHGRDQLEIKVRKTGRVNPVKNPKLVMNLQARFGKPKIIGSTTPEVVEVPKKQPEPLPKPVAQAEVKHATYGMADSKLEVKQTATYVPNYMEPVVKKVKVEYTLDEEQLVGQLRAAIRLNNTNSQFWDAVGNFDKILPDDITKFCEQNKRI